MQCHEVTSRELSSVSYDESASILEITFKTSKIYQYWDVPPNVFYGLMAARSKSSYLQRVIKNRFPHRRMR